MVIYNLSRKFSLTIILLLSVFKLGISQQLIPIEYDTTHYSHEIILSANAEISSTSLHNELISKLLFGGIITDDVKNSTLSKQLQRNRVGIDLNSELEYRNLNLFKSEKIGFLVRSGIYAIGSINYSKDLFGLIFNGNDDFFNKKATFSGSSISFYSFQKIGFGLINKKTKSNFSLNYYTISDYLRGDILKGELNQNIDGTSISLNLNCEYNTSQGSKFVKGDGIGFDLDYRFNIQVNEEKSSTFQFIAKNIGIANFKTDIKHYQIDTSLVYDGFKFHQVYGDNSVFKDSSFLKDTSALHHTFEKKILVLPGFLQFGKIVNENYLGKLQSFYGIRLYPTLAYSPMIYLGVNYSPVKCLNFGFQISSGGFSRFKSGFYSTYKLKKINLGIGTQDIIGVISKKGYGQSFLVRIGWKL